MTLNRRELIDSMQSPFQGFTGSNYFKCHWKQLIWSSTWPFPPRFELGCKSKTESSPCSLLPKLGSNDISYERSFQVILNPHYSDQVATDGLSNSSCTFPEPFVLLLNNLRVVHWKTFGPHRFGAYFLASQFHLRCSFETPSTIIHRSEQEANNLGMEAQLIEHSGTDTILGIFVCDYAAPVVWSNQAESHQDIDRLASSVPCWDCQFSVN